MVMNARTRVYTVVQFLNTCHQVGKDASVYLGIMWNNNDIVVE